MGNMRRGVGGTVSLWWASLAELSFEMSQVLSGVSLEDSDGAGL